MPTNQHPVRVLIAGILLASVICASTKAQAVDLDFRKSGWHRLQCDRLEPVLRLSAQ
jgi:hypothetical protein